MPGYSSDQRRELIFPGGTRRDSVRARQVGRTEDCFQTKQDGKAGVSVQQYGILPATPDAEDVNRVALKAEQHSEDVRLFAIE